MGFHACLCYAMSGWKIKLQPQMNADERRSSADMGVYLRLHAD